MPTFRPVDGFKISLEPPVRALVASKSEGDPAFAQYWDDILDRLRFVAHLEGVADHRFPQANRMWAAAADDERGLPRVRLVYLVIGNQVRIRIASIG